MYTINTWWWWWWWSARLKHGVEGNNNKGFCQTEYIVLWYSKSTDKCAHWAVSSFPCESNVLNHWNQYHIAVVIMCRTREFVHCCLLFWMSILSDFNAPTGDMYYRAYLNGIVMQHKKAVLFDRLSQLKVDSSVCLPSQCILYHGFYCIYSMACPVIY